MEDDDESPPLAVRIDELPEPIQLESSLCSDTSGGNKEEATVGVTVITGYLGAGKSTCLQYDSYQVEVHSVIYGDLEKIMGGQVGDSGCARMLY